MAEPLTSLDSWTRAVDFFAAKQDAAPACPPQDLAAASDAPPPACKMLAGVLVSWKDFHPSKQGAEFFLRFADRPAVARDFLRGPEEEQGAREKLYAVTELLRVQKARCPTCNDPLPIIEEWTQARSRYFVVCVGCGEAKEVKL